MTSLEKISWIGCGRVARTLAKACRIAGYPIGMVACRNLKNAEKAVEFIGDGEPGTDIVEAATSGTVHFITTNDDALSEVVQTLDTDVPGSLAGHYYFSYERFDCINDSRTSPQKRCRYRIDSSASSFRKSGKSTRNIARHLLCN